MSQSKVGMERFFDFRLGLILILYLCVVEEQANIKGKDFIKVIYDVKFFIFIFFIFYFCWIGGPSTRLAICGVY